MMALSNAAAKDIDVEVGELIKIRASQLNRCAFCLDLHTRDARKHGVGEQKLDVLAAWDEAGHLFTERERAALALTDAITGLGDGDVPDDVYAAGRAGVLRPRARPADGDGGDHQRVEPHQCHHPPATAHPLRS